MNPQTKQLVEAAKAVLNRNKPVDQIYRDLDKLQEAITAYEQSESSSRQQENDESDKTKTGIWRKWDSKPDLSYNEAAYGAMLEYAHQQTADKDREIEELKAEVTALKLVIDELTDGDCLKQSKAKLSGKIVKLKAEAERLKQQRYNWAGFILKVRDALVEKDAAEAYHWLYQIASPNFDKDSDEVWKEIEKLATTPPTNKVNNH